MKRGVYIAIATAVGVTPLGLALLLPPPPTVAHAASIAIVFTALSVVAGLCTYLALMERD